jgi:hypothetical protein
LGTTATELHKILDAILRLKILERSEGYYLGCDSNDDLPYYTASNREDRNVLSHRSEAQTPMPLRVNGTIASLDCDLREWCGSNEEREREREKVRAVKFPPRSDPLLFKHSSNKKKKIVYNRGPSSILIHLGSQ